MSDWNATQYLKFKAERTRPAIDLVNAIGLKNPADIIDIGCGPGNSTQILAQAYPNARILGIDSSQNMIDTAKSTHPNLEFMLCDASNDLTSLGRKFDVVFSNACIQWIPNHPELLKNMMGLLNEGGVMAVQAPMNYKEPIHKIIGSLSSSESWKDKFPNPRIFYNLTQSEYYDLLASISSDFTIWQTTYFHRMKSHGDIMEWYRSTGLRPYLNALSPDDRQKFEHEVLEHVVQAYPLQANGEVIFRFPRFFFTAVS